MTDTWPPSETPDWMADPWPDWMARHAQLRDARYAAPGCVTEPRNAQGSVTGRPNAYGRVDPLQARSGGMSSNVHVGEKGSGEERQHPLTTDARAANPETTQPGAAA